MLDIPKIRKRQARKAAREAAREAAAVERHRTHQPTREGLRPTSGIHVEPFRVKVLLGNWYVIHYNVSGDHNPHRYLYRDLTWNVTAGYSGAFSSPGEAKVFLARAQSAQKADPRFCFSSEPERPADEEAAHE